MFTPDATEAELTPLQRLREELRKHNRYSLAIAGVGALVVAPIASRLGDYILSNAGAFLKGATLRWWQSFIDAAYAVAPTNPQDAAAIAVWQFLWLVISSVLVALPTISHAVDDGSKLRGQLDALEDEVARAEAVVYDNPQDAARLADLRQKAAALDARVGAELDKLDRSTRRIRRIAFVGAGLLLLGCSQVLLRSFQFSLAISVNRGFSTDYRILRPHLSAAAADSLVSRYAQVSSQNDWTALAAHMESKAKAVGVKLRGAELVGF